MKTILLGGGCFWCTESVFDSLKGINSVVSGYAGGAGDTANYQAVCTGETGHVEVIEVNYDDSMHLVPMRFCRYFLPRMIQQRSTVKAMILARSTHQ